LIALALSAIQPSVAQAPSADAARTTPTRKAISSRSLLRTRRAAGSLQTERSSES
jgi:hypothetical protein